MENQAPEVPPVVLYTVAEAAEMFSVTSWTVRRWVAEGTLSGIKIGSHWRFRKEDLVKLAQGRYAPQP